MELSRRLGRSLCNHGQRQYRCCRAGNPVWQWQPVPYALDNDPDWSATPSVMLGSGSTMAVSTQKDGWTWAVNAGTGTPGPASVRWAFPPGSWSSSGFNPADGTYHGDSRYLRPGAVWDDVYIVQTGGYTVTTDVYEWFHHLYALNGCASDAERVRWIKDVPNASGFEYDLGPPTVTHGIIFVAQTRVIWSSSEIRVSHRPLGGAATTRPSPPPTA